MAARKATWGGRRKGAGRPPGTGPGPSPDARRNRVTVLLRDDEIARLQKLAQENDLPTGTMLYELVKRRLGRTRPGR